MAKKTINFEKSLERLQEISSLLESDEVSLEESIKLYEEGMKLSKSCYDILNKAELKVEELTNKLKIDLDE